MWVVRHIGLLIKTVFVVLHLLGFFFDRLLHLPRLYISVGSFLIAVVSYGVALKTDKIFFKKWAPFCLLLYHSIADNYLLYYLLSEEGIREGKEQFGDEHDKKMRQLVSTLESNFT